MSIDFVCGFECRIAVAGAAVTPDENHWDGIAGVPAISTSTVRTGSAALRCNSAGATVTLQKTVARTVVAGRVYVRFASFPATAKAFIRMVDANGAPVIQVGSAGAVTLAVGASANSATVATLSTGVWYRVDWLADTSGATASLKCTVDGGAEITQTQAQTSANITSVNFGLTGADTSDIFFDDLILGTATTDYAFGAGTVESMSPTRDGSHSFTAGDFGFNTAGADVAVGATDVYTYVDDVDLTSTADLIRQKVIRTAGYVQVGFSQGNAPNWWEPQAVNVVSSWHAAGTAADTIGMKLNDGGTLKTITNEAGTGLSDVSQTTICFAEKVLITAPSGGNWTAGKLESLLIRAGYSDDITPNPYWDGVMLEVAYGIAPPFPYINPMPPLIAQ